MFICPVFFFQAEDGIRDAQESRGLGDVYKRQTLENEMMHERIQARELQARIHASSEWTCKEMEHNLGYTLAELEETKASLAETRSSQEALKAELSGAEEKLRVSETVRSELEAQLEAKQTQVEKTQHKAQEDGAALARVERELVASKETARALAEATVQLEHQISSADKDPKKQSQVDKQAQLDAALRRVELMESQLVARQQQMVAEAEQASAAHLRDTAAMRESQVQERAAALNSLNSLQQRIDALTTANMVPGFGLRMPGTVDMSRMPLSAEARMPMLSGRGHHDLHMTEHELRTRALEEAASRQAKLLADAMAWNSAGSQPSPSPSPFTQLHSSYPDPGSQPGSSVYGQPRSPPTTTQ
eukprot:TRINITY_DN10808_c0_g1_i1.p1 TRINITY_DN10808_c0_g1~~TRINITY_DN10808_c0_g1_i1.p1  ORF type:complete len:362 (-),score=115.59 TRINITY_DN10808_c0_g1_i1:513-1598(-)